MGVGEVNLTARVLGKSEIDCGIGAANINLLGNSNDYQIDDKTYFKLIELGYLTHNENKYNALKNKQKEIQTKITNIKKEITELQQYLKTL